MRSDKAKNPSPGGGLIRKLRDFLGLRKNTADAPPPRPRARPPKTKAPDLEAQIRRILQSKGAAGRLQVISLDKIAAPPEGQEPDVFTERLQSTITQVILRRLGPGDSFTQTEGNSFIIIFDKLGKEDAELECVLIVQEVMQALFPGEPADSRAYIRTAAIDLDGRVAVRDVNVLAVIERLLREEQEKKSEPAGQKNEKAAEKEPTIAVRVRKSTPGVSAPEHDQAEKYENIMKVMPEQTVVFEYRPLWDVRHKVLSAYSCHIVSGGPDISEVYSHAEAAYRRAAVDFLYLGRVTHEMRRLYSVNRRLLMHCPVHIDTLCDAGTWATYKILCERISFTPMRRELVFELTGITPATDKARIFHAATRLKSHCRQVVACADPQGTDLTKFAGAPLSHLSMSASGNRAGEKQLMKVMDDYVAQAQELGFGAIATGLGSLSMTIAAVGSGFAMIGGDAIHPPVVRPEFVYSFEARNLLGKLLV